MTIQKCVFLIKISKNIQSNCQHINKKNFKIKLQEIKKSQILKLKNLPPPLHPSCGYCSKSQMT